MPLPKPVFPQPANPPDPTSPFQSRISSGLSLPMNRPAALRRFPPGPSPRPNRGASPARHSDPIVTQQARRRYPPVASQRLSRHPPPHFSTFCVGAPRRRCILRPWRAIVTRHPRPAPPPHASFRVTSPPFSPKGARSEPFGVHRPRQLVKGYALLNFQPRRGKVLYRSVRQVRFGSACCSVKRKHGQSTSPPSD